MAGCGRRFPPLDLLQLRVISTESMLLHCWYQTELCAGLFPPDMVHNWNKIVFMPKIKEPAKF